jgi:hypothetical protein
MVCGLSTCRSSTCAAPVKWQCRCHCMHSAPCVHGDVQCCRCSQHQQQHQHFPQHRLQGRGICCVCSAHGLTKAAASTVRTDLESACPPPSNSSSADANPAASCSAWRPWCCCFKQQEWRECVCLAGNPWEGGLNCAGGATMAAQQLEWWLNWAQLAGRFSRA